MADVKEIHIETEIEEIETEPSPDNDSGKPEEKTFVTRMREIAETALNTVKSEVEKEIEEDISQLKKLLRTLALK